MVTFYGQCWEFTGARRNGYGKATVAGRSVSTHRIVYETLVGSIPPELELDHLCRNKACYNPAHLEPVTRSVNIRRARAVQPYPRRSHCLHGHLYDENNTYMWRGDQHCRMCRREAAHRLRVRRSA